LEKRDAELEVLKARLSSAEGALRIGFQNFAEPQCLAATEAAKPLIFSPQNQQQQEVLVTAWDYWELEMPPADGEAKATGKEDGAAIEGVEEPAFQGGVLKAQVQDLASKIEVIIKQVKAQLPVEAKAVQEVTASLEVAGLAAAAEESRLANLSEALEDSMRTERLRDQMSALLKEEINELRRNIKASEVDTVYLKHVLVAALETGEFTASEPFLHVIGRLLVFSPEEMQRCSRGKGLQCKSLISAVSLPSFTRNGFSAFSMQ
jgi:hypothetical protein